VEIAKGSNAKQMRTAKGSEVQPRANRPRQQRAVKGKQTEAAKGSKWQTDGGSKRQQRESVEVAQHCTLHL